MAKAERGDLPGLCCLQELAAPKSDLEFQT